MYINSFQAEDTYVGGIFKCYKSKVIVCEINCRVCVCVCVLLVFKKV